MAAPPQRGTTRIGALGGGRPPIGIGIGSIDRPRLLRGEGRRPLDPGGAKPSDIPVDFAALAHGRSSHDRT